MLHHIFKFPIVWQVVTVKYTMKTVLVKRFLITFLLAMSQIKPSQLITNVIWCYLMKEQRGLDANMLYVFEMQSYEK